MKSFRIAFLPIVRTTFDVPLAEEMIRQAREQLRSSGLQLFEPDQPISDLAQAEKTARVLANESIDLLLIFQATFADSTMVAALTDSVEAPIFLWAIPEEWTGGRLRLNSLCGINLAGHALTLRKRQYDYAYGTPQDAGIIRKIRAVAAAGALRRKLKTARVGVVGEHPVGMDSCHLDEAASRACLASGYDAFRLRRFFPVHGPSLSRGFPKHGRLWMQNWTTWLPWNRLHSKEP